MWEIADELLSLFPYLLLLSKEKLLAIASYSGGIWRAIGFFVIAPLIYNVYSYFANTGDTDNLQYIETYIGDSRIIRVELPTNIDQLDTNFITNYRDRHRHLIYYFVTLEYQDIKISPTKRVLSIKDFHLCIESTLQ